MSRKLLSFSFAVALTGTSALADVPSVAVDIAPVHSLVARVMSGVGPPDLVIPPGASPHAHTLRPSEAAALQEADIVVWMGDDLTPWMADAVATLAEGADVLTLLEAEETRLLEFREDALFEAHDHGDHEAAHDDHAHEEGHDHGHEDHAEDAAHDDHGHEDHAHEDHAQADHAKEASHDDHEEHAHDDHGHEGHAHEDHAADAHAHEGHAHGDHDPHAWLSPTNATAWLNLIAAKLSAADPDNAGAYFANAAAAQAEMEVLSGEVNGILEHVRGGRFIVFHDAYQYFETEFEFAASGALSLSDASDPSPARIGEIRDRVRAEGIDCVLAEPQFNPGLVETVLQETDARTAIIDPVGVSLAPGEALYPDLIRGMARTLAECLQDT